MCATVLWNKNRLIEWIPNRRRNNMKMTWIKTQIFVGAALLTLSGCITMESDETKAPADAPIVVIDPASSDQVRECKDSCEKLKFFDCNDSQDLANCFQACEAAGAPQIELFVACVDNDICDPSCSLNAQALPDEPDVVSGGGTSGSVTGGDSKNPRSTDMESLCLDACDDMKFFRCVDTQTHNDCRTDCRNSSDAIQEDFVACVENGVCQDGSCYGVLNPEANTADVLGCQATCDRMTFFDCLDSVDHSNCRAACEIAESAAVEAFKACGVSVCDGPNCFFSLVESL
jgi:hypothetical protein